MIIKEYNGWKIWMRGIRPSSCDTGDESTYHVCNGNEHFDFQELQDAYDKLSQVGGIARFIIGQGNV